MSRPEKPRSCSGSRFGGYSWSCFSFQVSSSTRLWLHEKVCPEVTETECFKGRLRGIRHCHPNNGRVKPISRVAAMTQSALQVFYVSRPDLTHGETK